MDNLIIILPIQMIENANKWLLDSVKILIVSLLVLGLTILFFRIHSKMTCSKLVIISAQLITGRAVKLAANPLSSLVLMSTTFYMFFLLNCFQCRLISVLTIASKDPELTRIKEAADTDYQFNTEKIFKTSLENFEGSDTQSMAKIMSRNRFYETEELIEKFAKCSKTDAFITTGKGAFLFYESLKDGNGFRKNCFYNLKEHLNPVQLTFALKYGSPLLGKVNGIILRTFEAGLQRIWGKSAKSEANLEATKVIKFENLKSHFHFLCLGWALALAVLLLEVIAA